MKYLPNIPDAASAERESSGSDFLTSEEERGLIRSTSWRWPAAGIVFIALLLLFAWLVR